MHRGHEKCMEVSPEVFRFPLQRSLSTVKTSRFALFLFNKEMMCEKTMKMGLVLQLSAWSVNDLDL